jgi:hypothetical protein
MNVLLDKSNQNFKAAEFLKDDEQQFYAASVHCSYYCSFQLMAYILTYKLGVKNSANWLNLGDTKGSHERAIKIIFDEIYNQGLRSDAAKFKRMIESLKSNRVDADYKETIISKQWSEVALSTSKQINRLLIPIFNINI